MEQDANAEQVHDPIVQISNNYYQEAWFAKRQRMLDNADNFNTYHLKQDFSHKRAGQSKEFLPKVFNAVEQITNFLKQGIINADKWFDVGYENSSEADPPGSTPPHFTAEEMFKLLKREYSKGKMEETIPDAVKLALLGSLMIFKVHPTRDVMPSYFVDKASGIPRLKKRSRDVFRIKTELIRQEDYYPDPTGRGLYEMHEMEIDWHDLKKDAESNPGVYDMEQIQSCYSFFDDLQRHKKSRETDQNVTYSQYRRVIKVREYWGTILEQATGEVLYENCVWTVANGMFLIRKPQQNPFWHQMRPFVVKPLIRVPFSVWHKALIDAGTKLNRAINEIFNLMFDSALMSTFGIKQLRPHWLDDPGEVEEGIQAGQTIKANSSCPPGEKVLEVVQTGGSPQEAINMFNLVGQESNATLLTSDLRQGVLPPKEVKATEVQASNNTITGIFNGIVQTIESACDEVHFLNWALLAQFANDIDTNEVQALFGKDRAAQLAGISPEERFATTVLGRKFNTFGMSALNNKINDFRKLTSILQTIATNPMLVQEFSKKYDFGKLLTELMIALDIDIDKILKTPNDPNASNPQQLAQMVANNNNQTPDMQSQIPSASNLSSGSQPGQISGPQKMAVANPQAGNA